MNYEFWVADGIDGVVGRFEDLDIAKEWAARHGYLYIVVMKYVLGADPGPVDTLKLTNDRWVSLGGI